MSFNPMPPRHGLRARRGRDSTIRRGTTHGRAGIRQRSKAPGRNVRIPLAILVVLIVAAIVAAVIIFA